MGKTLFDKIWDIHVVESLKGGQDVLYIDRHLIHEVTSPQAFAGLRQRGIPLARPNQTFATADHNVPTIDQHKEIAEPLSRKQVAMLTSNCDEFGVELYGLGHKNQGIVHVIGPELGITQPGMTIVCGDSHTSTHGAFGCIAFGIGTSMVEQVFATQCCIVSKPKTMRITVNGSLQPGVVAKDVILYIISQIGTGGGTGHFVEFAGDVFKNMTMEGRMTVCNMSIEMGARGGLIAPDDTTFSYVEGKEFAPHGRAFEEAKAFWETLYSDADASFDYERTFNGADIKPMVTFGTNPGMGVSIDATIPETMHDSSEASYDKALTYMGLSRDKHMEDLPISHVFIGSCTNSRLEDLEMAAELVKGKKVKEGVRAMIVPGSQRVRKEAVAKKLDVIFTEAGFEFREPGCSACLGMNEDKIPAGEYCVSTSNRNFEGRQGPGARTILASPLTAAIAAIEGKLTDVRNYIS